MIPPAARPGAMTTTETPEILAALDHVAKRYPGEPPVLDDVSLTVRAGEVVTLLGPSGCGKSTVLRLVAGLETADAGRVSAPTRGIGLVFQDATLMPWASALDEITRFRLVDDLLRLKTLRRLGILFVTHSVYEAVSLSDRILVMSGTPGRITRVVDIPPETPRGGAFRASAAFAETAATVSRALAAAMGEADAVDAFARNG